MLVALVEGYHADVFHTVILADDGQAPVVRMTVAHHEQTVVGHLADGLCDGLLQIVRDNDSLFVHID